MPLRVPHDPPRRRPYQQRNSEHACQDKYVGQERQSYREEPPNCPAWYGVIDLRMTAVDDLFLQPAIHGFLFGALAYGAFGGGLRCSLLTGGLAAGVTIVNGIRHLQALHGKVAEWRACRPPNENSSREAGARGT